MRLSALFALAAPLLAFALPLKRTTSDNADDILVFQFADVLNHLENQFYTQALSKFQDSDFQAAGFSDSQVASQLFSGIASDESNHFQFLEIGLAALGGSPVMGCSFDFSSALTDVNTMLDTARVVENVGVAAFLGAAPLLIDPVILDAAASILTVEARHQTILNVLNLGSAVPQSFDIALSPSEVLAIAGSFISGCNLGIPANPSLAITNNGTIAPGTQLSFSSPAINGSTDNLFCQMMLGGQPASIPLPFNQCIVPEGINGPVALFITGDSQPLINNVIDRSSSQVVAGPTMAFIDTQPDTLSQVARPNAAPNSVSQGGIPMANSSMASISPAQVQSIIQGVTTSATSSTTATSSATQASPTSSTTQNPAGGGIISGENTTQGPVDGGAVIVNGWQTVNSIPPPGPSAG